MSSPLRAAQQSYRHLQHTTREDAREQHSTEAVERSSFMEVYSAFFAETTSYCTVPHIVRQWIAIQYSTGQYGTVPKTASQLSCIADTPDSFLQPLCTLAKRFCGRHAPTLVANAQRRGEEKCTFRNGRHTSRVTNFRQAELQENYPGWSIQ